MFNVSEPFLALPRPLPSAPATSAVTPDEIVTSDLALAAAAYAIESPGGMENPLAASVQHLAMIIDDNGGAPSVSRPDGSSAVQDGPAARYEAGLWAGLGLFLAAPQQHPEQQQQVVMAAMRCAVEPYQASDDVVRFGDFNLGEGQEIGPGETAVLLRETALAALVMLKAGQVLNRDMLRVSAREALLALMSRFRAPDGSRYAHAVTTKKVAAFSRESEGEALLALLALELRADDYADELLTSLEQYAVARLVPYGRAEGYAQGDLATPPEISVRATILVAAAQHAAGRFGAARTTLSGLSPLRSDAGLLSGLTALTVAADAALHHRYLKAAGA